MAEDAGVGILGSELLQQLVEGVLLGLGTGIGSAASVIQTTFIDNAKGTVVVVAGMDALDALGQQRYDIAIATDIIVVRALAVLGYAAGYQVLDTERAVAPVSHAVDDEQLDGVMF